MEELCPSYAHMHGLYNAKLHSLGEIDLCLKRLAQRRIINPDEGKFRVTLVITSQTCLCTCKARMEVCNCLMSEIRIFVIHSAYLEQTHNGSPRTSLTQRQYPLRWKKTLYTVTSAYHPHPHIYSLAWTTFAMTINLYNGNGKTVLYSGCGNMSTRWSTLHLRNNFLPLFRHYLISSSPFSKSMGRLSSCREWQVLSKVSPALQDSLLWEEEKRKKYYYDCFLKKQKKNRIYSDVP